MAKFGGWVNKENSFLQFMIDKNCNYCVCVCLRPEVCECDSGSKQVIREEFEIWKPLHYNLIYYS